MAATEREKTKSHDTMDMYLKDIDWSHLLTKEEEVDLFHKINKGDLVARNRMIESNLRLVVKIAKSYFGKGLEYSDLVEEGNLGLMHAIEKFDVSLGFRFSTYATLWIKQAIETAIMNHGRTVRLPIYVIKELKQYKQFYYEFSMKNHREPTIEEVAKALDKTPKDIMDMLTVSQDAFSIDEEVFDDGSGGSISDLMKDTNNVDPLISLIEKNDDDSIFKFISKLDDVSQDVIMMKYGLFGNRKFSVAEIADILKLTKSKVRMIHDSALVKLKRIIGLSME